MRFHVDSCLSMIAKKYVVDADKVTVDEECQVRWNGNELLSATLVAMGDKSTMDRTEEELLSCMCEEATDRSSECKRVCVDVCVRIPITLV